MAARRTPKKRSAAAPQLAKRYIVPFLSANDADMVGTELEKSAQANRVNGIRHLDPEVVFHEVETRRKHPFRELAGMNWGDDKTAARKHRIEYIRKLISSVQVVVVSSTKRNTFEPVFVSAQASVKTQGSSALRRSSIVRHDMLRHDPAFISYVNAQCRRILGPLAKLEHTASDRALPPEVQLFITNVRAAANASGFA